MAQFVLALLLGLALLTWAASSVVQTTARGWFERDVSSQGRLVLIGARPSLVNAWDGDPERNIISYQTAIGQAILGHKPGEHVTIPTEQGERQAEIVSVEPYRGTV